MKRTLFRLSNAVSRGLLLWVALSLPGQLWAQSSTELSEKTLIIYVLVAMLLVVVVGIVYVCTVIIRLTFYFRQKTVVQEKVATESGWLRFKKRHITGHLVPVAQEQHLLISHNYDGIQELDNYMPPWLKYTFWGTIAFAAIYLFNFAVLDILPTSEQEYVAEIAEAEQKIVAYKLTAAKGINEDNVKLVTDVASLTAAKGIFAQNCQACHGAAGEGGVGPNLTDEYWLHGGSIKDVFKTVKYGVPQKGMIAWQQKLQPDQIQQVASYILSLQGSNPANAKAPQGEKEAATPTPDTKVSMR